MVVYYELLFVDNLVINFLLLFFSSKFYALKLKLLRLLGVSALASVYAVFSLLDNKKILCSLPIKILMILLICFLAFGKSSFKRYIKVVLVFIITSFLVAGVLFFFFCQGGLEIMSYGIFYTNKLLRCVLYGIISILLSYRLYIYIHKSAPKSQTEICRVSISVSDNSIKTNALLDTGNMAVDPATGLPIILVFEDVFKEFPIDMKEDCFDIFIESIGGGGNIPAIKPDWIKIGQRKRKHECIIGIVAQSFEEEYRCILNPNHFV